jgi:hypothetical protein
VDGGNWEFVFMDGSNWELVDVDGSNWQVVTLGLESGIIGDPGQSEFLAFRRNPVGRSLVGVSVDFLFGFFAVIIDGGDGEFLLGLGFGTGGVVGLGVAIIFKRMFVSVWQFAKTFT